MKCEKGVLSVNGDLVPGRGGPAFISVVSLLSAEGKPTDMTGCEGVRLRVKVSKAFSVFRSPLRQSPTLIITRVRQSPVREAISGGADSLQGHETRLVGQTVLNRKTVTSVNLVSFGLSRSTFAYEVDEIGFY